MYLLPETAHSCLRSRAILPESLVRQLLRPLRPSPLLGLHFPQELHALLVACLLGVVNILLASLGPL